MNLFNTYDNQTNSFRSDHEHSVHNIENPNKNDGHQSDNHKIISGRQSIRSDKYYTSQINPYISNQKSSFLNTDKAKKWRLLE